MTPLRRRQRAEIRAANEAVPAEGEGLARYMCRLNDGAPVNRHRPSVDVMMRSVANHAGPNAVGAVLTGMGGDGARGLLEMKDAGAPTLVQDEATSVVWGMPGSAVRLGAADRQLPIEKIAAELLRLALD